MGGADVKVGKEVNNPSYRVFGGTNYSLVFGADGKLAYYLRSELPTSRKSSVPVQ